MNKPDKIITHHAVSSTSHTAQDVQLWHKKRWNSYNPSPTFKAANGEPYYVGYHYIIEWDGNTVQCRAHDEEGVHTKGQNFSSIGVCFIGNMDVHYPSEEQKEAWAKLYSKLTKEFGELPSFPHRKYSNTSCHGKLLSDTYYTDIISVSPKIKKLESLLITLEQLTSRVKALITQERMRG